MQFLKEKREKSFSEEEIRKDFEKLATSFKNATPENYYKKRENTKDASEIYKKYKGQFDSNSSMYKEGSDPFYFEYDGETYTGMEEPTPARYIDKNSTVRLTKGAYIHKIPLEDFDKSKFKPLGYLRQKYVKERGGMVDKFFFDKNEKADDLKFAKDEWDENKHPRNKDGKFGNGSGQKSSIEKSAKSKEEKIKEIPESYRKVYEKAVESEPEITDMIKTVCKASGGKPAGLDFRLKTVESYMRKVKADSEEGKNEEDVANNLYDVVRYTNELSTKEFKKGVDIAVKELHNKGCKLVQLKNFYLHKNNPYRGINCKFESPDGQKFELQFNTPNNLVIKEQKLHPVYERWREMPNGVGKVDAAYEMDKITEEFDNIPDVERVEEYPPEK